MLSSEAAILVVFILLYVLFIMLIRGDLESFGFLRCQVHTFFIFIVVMSSMRILASIAEVKIKHNADQIYALEDFNIVTECVFNLFILYYFISISKKKEDINRRATMVDDHTLLTEDRP